MKVKPLRGLVIVKREKSDERTKGGLYIPPSAQTKSTVGFVVAVGEGRILENGTIIEPQVREGDKVIFGEWVGQEIKIDEEMCLILEEKSLGGVITD